MKRAEDAGCPVVAVTVDTPAGRNTATATKLRRDDTRVCSGCHVVDERGYPRGGLNTKPMFAGIETQGLGLTSASLTWDFVKRLKDATKMKVVLKGIEDGEDAAMAVKSRRRRHHGFEPRWALDRERPRDARVAA